MGLKTKNYLIKSTGLLLPEAYCLVKGVRADRDRLKVTAHIQMERNSADTKNPLEIIEACGRVTMSLPLGEQSYAILKEKLYGNWEDDIVSEDEVTDEIPLEP